MGHLEKALKQTLYRALCPDPVVLGEYHLGQLPPEQAETIRQHVVECHHCAGELRTLEDYFRTLAPETDYTIREKVQTWVAKLLPQGGRTGNTGALVQSLAVRGLAKDHLQRFTFGEGGELAIEVRADPQDSGHSMMLGLLIAADSLPREMTAVLQAEDQFVAQGRVDAYGNFTLSGLLPGQYTLLLQAEEIEIQVPGILIPAA